MRPKKTAAARAKRAPAKKDPPRKSTRRRGQRGAQLAPPKAGSVELISRFYSEVPESEWLAALESHPSSSPAGKLFGLMQDSGFGKGARKPRIETLCAEAGIEFRDLVTLFVEHRAAHALIKAADHTEEVVLGLAEDAKSRVSTCDLCLGLINETTGRTYLRVDHPYEKGGKLEIECPKCSGSGKQRKVADARARDTFLRVTGTLVDEKQPLLQLNQQFNFGQRHSAGVTEGQKLLEEGRKMRQEREKSQNRASKHENPPSMPMRAVKMSSGDDSDALEAEEL